MLKGRGTFHKKRVVDGGLEISISSSTDDARLRRWISESRAVLPRLQAMVENGDGRHERLPEAVEDLRRRVEALEEHLAQLRRDPAGA